MGWHENWDNHISLWTHIFFKFFSKDLLVIKGKPLTYCQINMTGGPVYKMVKVMTQNEISEELFLTVVFFSNEK